MNEVELVAWVDRIDGMHRADGFPWSWGIGTSDPLSDTDVALATMELARRWGVPVRIVRHTPAPNAVWEPDTVYEFH